MEKPKGTFKCFVGHYSDGSELVEKSKEVWGCPVSGRKTICLVPVLKVSDMSLKEYRESRRRAK